MCPKVGKLKDVFPNVRKIINVIEDRFNLDVAVITKATLKSCRPVSFFELFDCNSSNEANRIRTRF